MGKKGPLWWRESDWLLRGSSAANQILLRHSGPILSYGAAFNTLQVLSRWNDKWIISTILHLAFVMKSDDIRENKKKGMRQWNSSLTISRKVQLY